MGPVEGQRGGLWRDYKGTERETKELKRGSVGVLRPIRVTGGESCWKV